MRILNALIGGLFSLLLFPFKSLDPWLAMIFLSLLSGLLVLFIFRTTSNQEGIRKIKDTIKAHILEIRLYRDSLPVTLRAQGKILRANLKYMAFSAKPMLAMLLPLFIILTHLNLWFGYESLRMGETAILKVYLKEHANPIDLECRLEVSPGVAIESPPLRIEEGREINWRISARREGVHALRISLAGETAVTINLIAGARSLTRICPRRSGRLLDAILYPGETRVPASSSVASLEIAYPPKRLALRGLRLHWLIPYLVLTIVFGFALKRPLGVEI